MGKTYQVPNKQWGIYSDGTNAVATRDGLNAAFQYAKNQGYTSVELLPGTYLIDVGETDISVRPTRTIELYSNTTYLFHGVTFKIPNNSYPGYVLLNVWKQEHVTIVGATLIGDRTGHNYTANPIYPTHEFGYGVQIAESNYVTIDSCNISEMTGDAVFTKGVSNPVVNCLYPVVRNSKLHHCRRQGISLLSALHGVFENNEIYSIRGTNPQFGIDCEPDQSGGLVEYCKFDNNKFWDNVGDINMYKGSHNIICNNEFSSTWGYYSTHGDENQIVSNTFINGSRSLTSSSSICKRNQHINNIFFDSEVSILEESGRFIGNKIYNGTLIFGGANFYSEGNEINTSSRSAKLGISTTSTGYGTSNNDVVIGPYAKSIHTESVTGNYVVFNNLRIKNYYYWGSFNGEVYLNNLNVDKGTETTATTIETYFANNSKVVFNGGTISRTYVPIDINSTSPLVIFKNVNFIEPNSYIWVRNTSNVVLENCYFRTNSKKILDCYGGGSLKLINNTVENTGATIAVILTTNLTANAYLYNNVLFGCTMTTKTGDTKLNNIVV